MTTEITSISRTQHEKEELGWRLVVKRLVKKAAKIGRVKQLR